MVLLEHQNSQASKNQDGYGMSISKDNTIQ